MLETRVSDHVIVITDLLSQLHWSRLVRVVTMTMNVDTQLTEVDHHEHCLVKYIRVTE